MEVQKVIDICLLIYHNGIFYLSFIYIIGTLRYHLNKPYHQFEGTLMVRMVRAALICPELTVNQKKGVVTTRYALCILFLYGGKTKDKYPLNYTTFLKINY